MWQLDFISNSKTRFHVVQRQLYSRERKKQRKREVSVRQRPGFCLRIYRKQKLGVLHSRTRKAPTQGVKK